MEEGRFNHINGHMEEDSTKIKHGVFLINAKEVENIIDTVIKNKDKMRKIIEKRGNVENLKYCFERKCCGYELDKNGNEVFLDHITVILSKKGSLVTAYPSRNLFLHKEKTRHCQNNPSIDEGR